MDPQDNQDDLEAAIARDLPGWQLSTDKRKAPMPPKDHVKEVGHLEALRRKFLEPHDVVPDRTILVEPIKGGPPKVADVVNGRVYIVQG